MIKEENELIYLADNNKEVRKQLESLGYEICHCCKYVDAKWLRVSKTGIHGSGYPCDNNCKDATPDKCIQCEIKDEVKVYKRNVHIFSNVEDMMEYIKSKKE